MPSATSLNTSILSWSSPDQHGTALPAPRRTWRWPPGLHSCVPRRAPGCNCALCRHCPHSEAQKPGHRPIFQIHNACTRVIHLVYCMVIIFCLLCYISFLQSHLLLPSTAPGSSHPPAPPMRALEPPQAALLWAPSSSQTQRHTAFRKPLKGASAPRGL